MLRGQPHGGYHVVDPHQKGLGFGLVDQVGMQVDVAHEASLTD